MRGSLVWTPDGRGLAYTHPSGRSIWVQPIDGGQPRVLAEYARGDIVDFEWSPDGTQLAIVRSTVTSNVVLLKGVN